MILSDEEDDVLPATPQERCPNKFDSTVWVFVQSLEFYILYYIFELLVIHIYPCFSSSKPGRKRVKKVVDKTYMDAAG